MTHKFICRLAKKQNNCLSREICSLQVVADPSEPRGCGELPQSPLPRSRGNTSAQLSQRTVLPVVATLLSLRGSQETPLPRLFTTQNEEQLPEYPAREAPAERVEQARAAASKRQRRRALLAARRAARAAHAQERIEQEQEMNNLPSPHRGGNESAAEARSQYEEEHIASQADAASEEEGGDEAAVGR